MAGGFHHSRSRERTGPALRSLGRWLTILLIALGASGALAAHARAADNASAAAGFIESAQNKDGGFGAKREQRSNAEASLWAAMALLAAGRNPTDERVAGGASLDEYLAAHASGYTSLEALGLLAMVQSAAQGSSDYDQPAARLEHALTEAAVRSDPGGAALAVLGLLATGTSAARARATAAAQTLLSVPTSDGGWGAEGLSDSASTALVLQALAASGVAGANAPAVQAGVAYLHRAQGNDGSIALSIRTDQAIASGSVTATAFTIQALTALGLPTLRTANGKTVLEGLAQYQQQGSGGLSSDGSLYSQIPPSVTETAEAFPAFDGIVFPLASVAPAPSTPSKHGSSAKPRSRHVSAGSAAQGVSGGATTGRDQGAFKQASTAAPTGGAAKHSPARGSTAAKHAQAGARKASTRSAASAPAGAAVSGEVVGGAKPARLVAVAGQSGGGLSAKAKATLLLAAILLACALLGGLLDSRRPRQDGRSLAAVGVAGLAGFLRAARARGAYAPFAVALVGAALIAFPFATRMFDRTPPGAHMIAAFKPYMQPARLAAYERDVRQLDEGFGEAARKSPALIAPHASVATANRRLQADSPQLSQFDGQWPQAHRTLAGLLDTIAANRTNYDAVAALPRFTLFPWFFIVPGALLVALAAIALIAPASWRLVRWGVVAVAIGLLLAPVAFHMWERAPRGASMVDAFRTVETRGLVVRVQNDFATITTGEGALSGELVPALEARGMSSAEIDRELPAVVALEGRWIEILQDLTPMIGVMSDNVANYQAVAALPSFRLFPWLFSIAGLLALAPLALSASRGGSPPRRGASLRRRERTPHAQPVAPGAEPLGAVTSDHGEGQVEVGARAGGDASGAQPLPQLQQDELQHAKEHDVLSPT